MDDELNAYNSEIMTRAGSVGCFTKQTITNSFECVLACIALLGLIYISVLVLGLAQVATVDTLFYAVGYISLLSLVGTPLGLYGSSTGSYCALFLFFTLASYHLYALVMYLWFNVRNSALFLESSKTKGFEILHQVTTGSYTALLALGMLMVSMKIISNINQINPARVIVVDNNSND